MRMRFTATYRACPGAKSSAEPDPRISSSRRCPDAAGQNYQDGRFKMVYAYVLNNPLTLVNPAGLDVWAMNGKGDYSVFTDEEWDRYVNDPDCDFSRYPVPAGALVPRLDGVWGRPRLERRLHR